jgi:GntR family transcriptional regulator of vanillate catabolism
MMILDSTSAFYDGGKRRVTGPDLSRDLPSASASKASVQPSAEHSSADPIRVAPRARIVDEVLHRLRESILNHSIPPGARLIQTELADRMGVSRTPLREAIRLLEEDGLVQVSDGNRTVEVVRLSRQDLVDLYAIREVIDGLAARTLAARGMDEALHSLIGQHITTMAQATEPFRGEDYFVAHINFHTSIIQRCGNRRLASQLPLVRMTAASLRDTFPRFVTEGRRTSAAAARQTARAAHEEHVRVLKAIENQDPEEAERAAREHIANAVRYFPED